MKMEALDLKTALQNLQRFSLNNHVFCVAHLMRILMCLFWSKALELQKNSLGLNVVLFTCWRRKSRLLFKVEVTHSSGVFKAIKLDWLLVLRFVLIISLSFLSRRHKKFFLNDKPKSMSKCISPMHKSLKFFIYRNSSANFDHACERSDSGGISSASDTMSLPIEAVAFLFKNWAFCWLDQLFDDFPLPIGLHEQ